MKELWHNRRVQVHFGTIIRIGSTVYGSSGEDGPAQITALDVKSGDILWQSGRKFAKAQLVLADGKLVVLDQDGVLALASPSPKGLRVHSRGLAAAEPRMDAADARWDQTVRPRQEEPDGARSRAVMRLEGRAP